MEETISSLILITGGARSGKSSFAEGYALTKGKKVAYIATAKAYDEEMRERIKIHQQSRPSNFITREESLYPHRVLKDEDWEEGTVFLLDCLTLLLTNHLLEGSKGDEDFSWYEKKAQDALLYIESLLETIQKKKAPLLVVTNEVGMGLVPDNLLGRVYRDLAGKANQMLGRKAGEVWFLVSGIPQRIK